jgi:hypothetical protein
MRIQVIHQLCHSEACCARLYSGCTQSRQATDGERLKTSCALHAPDRLEPGLPATGAPWQGGAPEPRTAEGGTTSLDFFLLSFGPGYAASTGLSMLNFGSRLEMKNRAACGLRLRCKTRECSVSRPREGCAVFLKKKKKKKRSSSRLSSIVRATRLRPTH